MLVSQIIMLRSKAVVFIGTPWNLYGEVSMPMEISPQLNSARIRLEDMEIISLPSLNKLLSLMRKTLNPVCSPQLHSYKTLIALDRPRMAIDY
jgi:hypothetical protein